MIRVVASSHYYQPLSELEKLPSLDERIAELCRERYRRIDRFVQLALLGACECARGRALESDCGLYLASGVGPISSNVAVQDAIHRDHKLPMPFSFVNTLGSSACYHVAKDLALSGEAILVSRDGGSFAAALASAIGDLEAGIFTQVLVGAVEECILPGARQRALLRKASDFALAEGSHWMLLEQTPAHERDATGTSRNDVHGPAHDDARYVGYESRDAALLTGYLAQHTDRAFALIGNGSAADPFRLVS